MYEDRVAKGAALLDEHYPGWAARIAADDLAMSLCDKCVLGQVYGDYWDGFRTIKKRMPWGLYSTADFGFTLRDSEQTEAKLLGEGLVRFDRLADAWRAEIRQRIGKGDDPA